VIAIKDDTPKVSGQAGGRPPEEKRGFLLFGFHGDHAVPVFLRRVFLALAGFGQVLDGTKIVGHGLRTLFPQAGGFVEIPG
jgi:hypothetical protein